MAVNMQGGTGGRFTTPGRAAEIRKGNRPCRYRESKGSFFVHPDGYGKVTEAVSLHADQQAAEQRAGYCGKPVSCQRGLCERLGGKQKQAAGAPAQSHDKPQAAMLYRTAVHGAKGDSV